MAQRIIETPEIPRIRQVLQFVAAVALGAAASAVLGAFGSAQALGDAQYLREWQLWWAGNWLGSLCIAPVLLGWAVRWRAPAMSAPPAPAVEIALMGGALLGVTVWVFSAPSGSVSAILDPPCILLALVIVSAFRLPPRWSATLAALAHDALGLGTTVFAIQHWFFARRRDMRSAASRPW